MGARAEREIAALRRDEARDAAEMAEADRLVMRLLSHFACNFVVADIPDRAWVALPPVGRQAVMLQIGMPPRDRKGLVGVSLGTLRILARSVS